MTKKKSLYDEIIDVLDDKCLWCKTDEHYRDGAFQTTGDAVYHALSDVTGKIRAVKEGRDLDRAIANKKKLRKSKASKR